MSLSMYDASIPVFIRMFGNISKILETASAYGDEQKIDLANAKLADDMYPLTRQIQIATDGAKGCGARLAGINVPSYEDNEQTIAELQARIAKTVAFLETLTPEQINGSEGKEISLKVGGRELVFSGQNYLLNFVLPNFYFHLSITYAILRHHGVKIGKLDYLGGI